MQLQFSRIVASILGGAALVALGGAADAPAVPQPDKDGFISLFDGKSLDGWQVGDKADAWSVQDGQIVINNGPSHLFYTGPIHNHDWKNFDLKAEVLTHPHANSGIYFHTTYQEKGWPDDGFECQVNCTHKDWKKTGSLYDVVDIKDPHHKDNEWFLYEIIVKDKHVTLKINNEVVMEWTQPDDWKSPRNHKNRVLNHGTFALQGHDPKSETHFKSIVVKSLDE